MGAPESASVSGLFMRLQGDTEGSAKHLIHTEPYKRPRTETTEIDGKFYCINTDFKGNMTAVMTLSFFFLLNS